MRALRVTEVNYKFRDGPRRPLRWKVSLWDGDIQYPCTMLDLSIGGAKVQLTTPLEPGNSVRLEIIDLCIIEGRASWNKYSFVGIQFTTKPDEVRSLLGEKAKALRLDEDKGSGGSR